MITIDNERQLAEIFLRLREYHELTRDDLGQRVRADRRTVAGRETGEHGYTVPALIDTGRAFGYRLVLIADDEAGERQAAA